MPDNIGDKIKFIKEEYKQFIEGRRSVDEFWDILSTFLRNILNDSQTIKHIGKLNIDSLKELRTNLSTSIEGYRTKKNIGIDTTPNLNNIKLVSNELLEKLSDLYSSSKIASASDEYVVRSTKTATGVQKVIWKYKLPLKPKFQLRMPLHSDILCLQILNGSPCIWVKVNPLLQDESRQFRLLPTGQNEDEENLQNYIDFRDAGRTRVSFF